MTWEQYFEKAREASKDATAGMDEGDERERSGRPR